MFEKFHQVLSNVVTDYEIKKSKGSVSMSDTNNMEGLRKILETHCKKPQTQRNASKLRLEVAAFVNELPVDWLIEALLFLFTKEITFRQALANVLSDSKYTSASVMAEELDEINTRHQRILDNSDTQRTAALLEENTKLKEQLELKTQKITALETNLRIQQNLSSKMKKERDEIKIKNVYLTGENASLKQQLANLQNKLADSQAKNTITPLDTASSIGKEKQSYTQPGIFRNRNF